MVEVETQILPDRFRGDNRAPIDDRSIEGLGGCRALMKWKSLVLLYSITRPALRRILDIIL